MLIWGSAWEEKLFETHRLKRPLGSQNSADPVASEPAPSQKFFTGAIPENIDRKIDLIDWAEIGYSLPEGVPDWPQPGYYSVSYPRRPKQSIQATESYP